MNNKITPVSSLNPWPRLEHESIGSFLPLWKSHHTFSIDLLNHWFATKRHVLEQEFIKKKEKKLGIISRHKAVWTALRDHYFELSGTWGVLLRLGGHHHLVNVLPKISHHQYHAEGSC